MPINFDPGLVSKAREALTRWYIKQGMKGEEIEKKVNDQIKLHFSSSKTA
jgi:hypothetical protein